MAIPIVASDVKGNREVVEHSWNGLLVPYGDSVALAGSAQALLADPERAHDMGQHGRRLALQHFDEQRVFERVLSVYTWLLLERGLAAPATEARACPAGQALTDERWLS